MLELCPVCEKKKLVGRHKIACQRDKPTGWFAYEALLMKIDLNRPSRREIIDKELGGLN